MEELNFALEKGNIVEIRKPHQWAIGTVVRAGETYHIHIVTEGIVEFDKIYGVGGGWYISEKIV